MLMTVQDFEAAARTRLDPVHADFIAGGAADEITVRANEEAFRRLRLLPRVLRGSTERALEITLLGSRARTPVLLSPTAFHKLVCSEGELATARAAAAAGAIMIVSMASTVAVEAIARAARDAGADGDPAPLWFQLYLQPDLEFTEALVRRATDAGCAALVVTVDSPVRGVHERDLRNGFLDLPDGLRCEHMADPRQDGRVRPIAMSPEISWEHLDWLRGITSLPILLKGVLHPEDARLAVHHGADGLVLSNHGGRQLDTVPATIELLPEMYAAVGGRVPIVLDGGVRRGTDVVKALALGASAVGIGRPVMWALAEGGEKGVRRLLELLREEFDQALALCGARGATDLGPDLVRAPAWGPAPPFPGAEAVRPDGAVS
ncbi:alpha-hydroxy acid oxidase [Streptomyces sp. RKCA744]|uniref:alpha-hydroxy acid oxidase n=1 Tax=Streptomyces sp. RKCA744 TaxID=2959340 RepID=UPI00209F6E10|nr:alpha-hydroxy acid oxidase [Streptomyces sp. RKCA744]MCO8305681.1 alpha-hydroxy-acid oxidizing protein [Streptomyces sp. RKCA744]